MNPRACSRPVHLFVAQPTEGESAVSPCCPGLPLTTSSRVAEVTHRHPEDSVIPSGYRRSAPCRSDGGGGSVADHVGLVRGYERVMVSSWGVCAEPSLVAALVVRR